MAVRSSVLTEGSCTSRDEERKKELMAFVGTALRDSFHEMNDNTELALEDAALQKLHDIKRGPNHADILAQSVHAGNGHKRACERLENAIFAVHLMR